MVLISSSTRGAICLQPFQVRREQFDFNRVGRQLQIADDVGENAGKFPAHHREPLGEFVAQFGDDFVRRMLAVGFEFDREVAAIRLGDEHAHFRAEPPRITLDIRVGAENVLRLVEDARRFGEARAGRRPVINHKTAFVKVGQEIGLQVLVNENAAGENQSARQQRQPAMPQRHAHGAFVNPDDPRQQKSAFQPCRRVAVLHFFALADEPRRQRRRQREREDQRHEQRHDHRQRQRPEKHAGHAGQKRERDEHHHRRQRRADERIKNFADGFLDSRQPRPAGGDFHAHRLHDDDGVVNDQADAGRDAAERHHVEAHVRQLHGDEGDEHGDGDGDDGRPHAAPVFQEEIQNEHRQDEAEDDGVPDAADGVAHELRLVVVKREVHVRRQFLPELLQFRLQRGGDVQRAAVGLALDVQQNGLAALRGDVGEGRRRSALDARHVPDANRMAAADGNHHVADVVRRMDAPVHRRQVKVIIFLDHAGGRDEVVFRQRVAHFLTGRGWRPAISAGPR